LRADARGVTGSRSVLTSRIGALVDGTLGTPVWIHVSAQTETIAAAAAAAAERSV
jgi:hypothetical protein